MSKPVFNISAPFDTFSGYGARSQAISVKAIIELDKYKVRTFTSKMGGYFLGFL